MVKMIIYDTANRLAQEIKQSEEYINYNMAKVQDLYVALYENSDAVKFFEAETKFNLILADVNKIIGDAVMDVLK